MMRSYGLGLVATGRRNIRPGKAYDTLYARHELLGTNPIIGGDHSTTYDTLNHMAHIVRTTLIDTKKVAPTLQGKTLRETLRNCWEHVYNHFQYKIDATGIEQIRRPSRSWLDRKEGIDCDCMSVVLSSLLHHLKINHAFRKAEYKPEVGWQHVYVVVPKENVSITLFEGERKTDRNQYYVLDTVVDQFDYEVPYLKKFDKPMKIQYLNGADILGYSGGVSRNLAMEQLLAGYGTEFDALDALDGLSGVDENVVLSAFLNGLKQHLINTRQILAINPHLTSGLYDAQAFAKRLDALIEAFDTPHKLGNVLGELVKLEEHEQLQGFQHLGFLKKVRNAVKKAANKVASATKKVANKVGEGLKKIGKAIVRYNPATIAIRNGLILAMKINLFRLAEKIGYGYWTEQEAQSKGLELNEWKKNRDVLEKVRKIHKGMGGKLSKLDSAIKQGWNKGVKKHNLVHGLGKAFIGRNVAQQKALLAVKQRQLQAATPLLQLVTEKLNATGFKSILNPQQNHKELQELFLAIKQNKNGIATKLSLAYKPAQVANSYEQGSYRNYLSKVQSIEALVAKYGGTPAQLKEAVDIGKQVALSGLSLGAAAETSTSMASVILAKIAHMLKSVNFAAMFKGRANSPNVDESDMKTVDVTDTLSEDDVDEGDPNVTPVTMDKLLTEYAPKSELVNRLTSSPSVQTITNLTTNKAKEVAQEFTRQQALQLLQKVQKSPKVQEMAKSPLVQELKKVIVAPTKQNDNIQEAEVIESKIEKPNKTDNTVKYVAMGVAAATGLYVLSKAFTQQRSAISKSNKQDLQGTPKKSSRTKNVLAISM
ncbi:MAG: hypothetical protein ACK5OS_01645 [Chryseotalea sp.]